MTQLSPPSRASEPRVIPGGDRGVILACLTRIRRRLWAVRLTERLALAIAWGGGLGLLATAARLLRAREPWGTTGAYAASALMLLATLWLFQRRSTLARLSRGTLTDGLIKAAAGLSAALALATALLVLLPAGGSIAVWAFAALPAVLFMMLAVASVRLADLRGAAIFVDQQAGLEERVSTALELLETPADSPLEEAFRAPVIESAVAACQQVKRAKVGYWRLDRRAYALAALAALAATGVAFLPPLRPIAQPTPKKFIAVQSAGKKLAEVLQDLEKKDPKKESPAAEAIKPLDRLAKQLQEGTMSPMEQAAAAAEAKAEMQKSLDAMEAADKVQNALKDMEQTKDFAAAADALKDSRVAGAKGESGAPQKQQGAQQALDKATSAMADKMKNGGMSDSDKKGLADDLRKAASQAGSDSQLQKDLNDAADAAQKGNADQMAKSLQSAGERMGQQGANHQLSQGDVKRAMAEIDRATGNSGMTDSQQSQSAQNGQNGQSGDSGNQSGQPGGDQGSQANGSQGQQDGQQGQQGSNGGQQAGAQGQQGGQQGEGQGGQGGNQQTAGSGSTNFEQKGGPGDVYQGTEVGNKGSFVRIYDQRDIASSGATEKVAGHIDPLGKASGTIQVMGEGQRSDSTIGTYRDQLPGAKQRAMDDLSQQRIPPQYEEMVKTFYEK